MEGREGARRGPRDLEEGRGDGGVTGDLTRQPGDCWELEMSLR